ncbi:MAG: penicillin-binding protein 2 [Acidimicrobiia bacterium]|nr:penicillin-binding protein 2 [Acidimicrobiia bacterium]
MNTGVRVRISIVGVVVFALFAALFARLWFLQVASRGSYAEVAQANRVRIVPIAPPRGRILDVRGRPLAENRVARAITVDRRLKGARRRAVVNRLAVLLGTPVATIEKRLDDKRVSPYAPVPVATDVPIEVLTYVSEHQEDFPGVRAVPLAVRSYPNGRVAANVVGYVGEIGPDELSERKDEGYALGDTIGRSGAEQAFEEYLHGRPGAERLEVDARGEVVGHLSTVAPRPGQDVQLTIDLDVQRLAEQSLSQGIAAARDAVDDDDDRHFKAPAGAVVVIDPTDGSVRALASNPGFDPNGFVGGIPTDKWRWLNDRDNHYPLIDRATAGLYAPGSTFKLVTAIAGLQSGLITPYTTIDDEGVYRFDRDDPRWSRTNAGGARYGPISLSRALTVSSDVFFYNIGGDLWRWHRRGDPNGDALQAVARDYGFGATTGIGLPGEAEGRIPDAAWKVAFNADNPDPRSKAENSVWYPGDNISLAVGQGDVLVTPLQLARAYAAFAAGGQLRPARLLDRILDPSGEVARTFAPGKPRPVPVPERDTILTGLQGVVSDPKGTAAGAFAGFPLDRVPLAGKTGTAEVQGKQDTSLFVAFGPVGAPRYVVLSVVEEAGFGAQTSAPIVRRVIEGIEKMELSEIAVSAPTAAGN